MPLYNKTKNHYFSFNMGPIHFIALDYDFYLKYESTDIGQEMMNWV